MTNSRYTMNSIQLPQLLFRNSNLQLTQGNNFCYRLITASSNVTPNIVLTHTLGFTSV